MIERTVDAWGRVIFRGEDAVELLFRGCDISKLNIEITPEIEAYNAACVAHDKQDAIVRYIETPSEAPEEIATQKQNVWWIPPEYLELNMRDKLLAMCQDQIEIDRVNMEMDKFEERELLPVLRLMCYLVDRWRMNGVVWGVGRGSSVASYCLFLIGVHKINSIAFNLPIEEFLK